MKEIVKLRKLAESDTANIVRWRNSPSVKCNLYSQEDITEEQHLNYFHNVVETGKCAQYIIVVKDENGTRDIGTTFIKNIDRHSNKGEFGIFIGEECARGKGYAKYAISEIVRIAFEEIKLHRVYLSVMADNIPAIKAYEKAGFSIEGTMVEDYLRDDKYINIVIMGAIHNK